MKKAAVHTFRLAHGSNVARNTLRIVSSSCNKASFSKSTTTLSTTQPTNNNKPSVTESIKYNKEEQLKSVASNTKDEQQQKSKTPFLFKFLTSGIVVSATALAILYYLQESIEKVRTLNKEIAEQKELLSQVQSGSSSNLEQQDELAKKEELIRQFNKRAEGELSNLKSSHDLGSKEIKTEFNTKHQTISSIEHEKQVLSEKIAALESSEKALKKELEQLNQEKTQLLQSIEEATRHTSANIVPLSTLKEKEGPLSEEDKNQFIVRIQLIEKKLAAKEQVIHQIQQDYESKLNKLVALTEEQSKLEMNNLLSKLNEKESELKSLKEKLESEMTSEKLRLVEELEKSLKEQSNELSALYDGHSRKRENQVKELEKTLNQLETVFNSSIEYFNDSLKLQKYTTAIISFEDAALNKKQGFKQEMEKLKQIANSDDLIQTSLKLIPDDVATSGVSTLEELRDRFTIVKEKALASSLSPSKAGFFGFVFSKVASLFVFPEEGLVDGDSVNSSLSRAEYYLKHRRLEEAMSELVKCCQHKDNSDLNFVLSDWMQEANNRVVVDQVVRAIQSHLVVLSQSVQ